VCDIDGAPLYQRDDDKPATIEARLEQQLPPMYEVVDYYSDRGVLSTVDGEQGVAEVTEALLRAIAQPAR
jgi:adenylate kinase